MGVVNIVSASAGSGKTYNMAYRYILTLIKNPSDYRHILAVTFTNKATDELKSRILIRLHELASDQKSEFEADLMKDTGFGRAEVRKRAAEARTNILHDYNNFAVMTIDKFFQRVMRAFIKELDVDLNFNIELSPDSLISQAIDRMLDDISSQQEGTLKKWILEMANSNIDDNASWNVKAELLKLANELFKESYHAVSDKVDSKKVLAEVIKKAREVAEEMTNPYIEAAQAFVKIMEDYGLDIRNFYNGSKGFANFVIQASKGTVTQVSASLIKAANSGVLAAKTAEKRDIIEANGGTLQGLLQKMVESNSDAVSAYNTYSILSKYYRHFALLTDLRKRVNDICTEEDILPISDVGSLIHKLIANNDAPFIYEKSGNRYSHFMIDEFQDTSTMQWRNFAPLLDNAISQSEEEPVILVGDVKQSIYRWRGGDWSLLAEGVERHFGSQVRSNTLQTNYRSKRGIVEFNNHLIPFALDKTNDYIDSKLSEACSGGFLTKELKDKYNSWIKSAYSDYYLNLGSDKEEYNLEAQLCNDQSNSGYATIELYDSSKPHPVIERICQVQERGYRAKDIAILVRTNEEAKKIASLLLEHKRSHHDSPYTFDMVTQEALEISSSLAVRFVAACMGLAINPQDRLCRATFNQFNGKHFEAALNTVEKEFLGKVALMQPDEAFEEIVMRYELGSVSENIPYLQAFHNQIINFCSRKIADTALLLKWWNESGYFESISLPEAADAITIATIHKSKGLGYKVVILPYCNWISTPNYKSMAWLAPNEPLSKDIDRFPSNVVKTLGLSHFSHDYYSEITLTAIDSLNTFYVALTRAQEELHIMTPLSGSKDSSKRQPDTNSNIASIIRDYVSENMGAQIKEEKPTTDDNKEDEDKRIILQWGNHTKQSHKGGSEQSQTSRFDTYSPKDKLAVRYSHQRYDEESRGEGLSPRDLGTMMHKVFEQAHSLGELGEAISRLTDSGEISAQDAATLRLNIESAMSNPQISSWFDGSWDEIHTEREIIDAGHSYRPDRVLVRKDGTAIVVDYKFGKSKNNKYHKQIKTYARLLKDMGYGPVSGYLWYIAGSEVEQVV